MTPEADKNLDLELIRAHTPGTGGGFDMAQEKRWNVTQMEPAELESLLCKIAMAAWLSDRQLDMALEFLRPLGEPLNTYHKACVFAMRAASSAQPVAMFKKAAADLKKLLHSIDKHDGRHVASKVYNALGNVQAGLGERVRGKEAMAYLQAAAVSYRSAREHALRDEDPMQQAKVTANMGLALASLGERLEGAEGEFLLNQAVAAHDEAADLYISLERPRELAQAMGSKGLVLLALGGRTKGLEGIQILKTAVDLLRRPLGMTRVGETSLEKATAQLNLGLALCQLGERIPEETGAIMAQEAVELFDGALAQISREGFPSLWAKIKTSKANALSILSQKKGAHGRKELREAVEAFEEVLTLLGRDTAEQQWALTQMSMGHALARLSRICGQKEEQDYIDMAIAAYDEAISAFGHDLSSYAEATMAGKLALVRLRLRRELGFQE